MKVVLVHNHPCGKASPSQPDIDLTKKAVELFRSVQIQLLDHLIVADCEVFSMACNQTFARMFINSNLAQLREI